MKNFVDVFARFINDESGQDLIEYALLSALIGLAAVVTLQSVATAIIGVFTQIVTKLDAAVPAA
jgi:pilus assembly protein Flp/PilA